MSAGPEDERADETEALFTVNIFGSSSSSSDNAPKGKAKTADRKMMSSSAFGVAKKTEKRNFLRHTLAEDRPSGITRLQALKHLKEHPLGSRVSAPSKVFDRKTIFSIFSIFFRFFYY